VFVDSPDAVVAAYELDEPAAGAEKVGTVERTRTFPEVDPVMGRKPYIRVGDTEWPTDGSVDP
jgi:hypothetical protein